MTRRAALLLALAALGAGCAADPAADPSAATPPVAPAPAGSAPHPFLLAVDGAPEVHVARARLLAARARAVGAAVLPDPTVSVEGSRMRRGGAEGLEVRLEQELPRWGERDAERAMAAADAAMARAELDEARGMVAAEVAAALARARSARDRAALLDEEAARLRALAELVTASVAAGGDASASDALALRTRVASAGLMAEDLRRMALDAEDDARSRLDLPTGMDLPDPLLPDAAEVARGSFAPLRMARARLAGSRARAAMARSHGFPMVGVGVGWEREDLAMADDGLMAMVEVSIPLYRDAHRAQVHAARAEGEAARRQLEAEAARAHALLRRARRAAEQAERAHRIGDETQARVEAELEALRGRLAAGLAGMGGGDILMRIFDRLDASASARTAAIEARTEAEAMAADLWRFIPAPESIP